MGINGKSWLYGIQPGPVIKSSKAIYDFEPFPATPSRTSWKRISYI